MAFAGLLILFFGYSRLEDEPIGFKFVKYQFLLILDLL